MATKEKFSLSPVVGSQTISTPDHGRLQRGTTSTCVGNILIAVIWVLGDVRFDGRPLAALRVCPVATGQVVPTQKAVIPWTPSTVRRLHQSLRQLLHRQSLRQRLHLQSLRQRLHHQSLRQRQHLQNLRQRFRVPLNRPPVPTTMIVTKEPTTLWDISQLDLVYTGPQPCPMPLAMVFLKSLALFESKYFFFFSCAASCMSQRPKKEQSAQNRQNVVSFTETRKNTGDPENG